jgi:hypothetical protein
MDPNASMFILLAKVKDLDDVSKTDLATWCSYVSQKDGSDGVHKMAFMKL